jgi:sodium-dependent phosphate cotransporter
MKKSIGILFRILLVALLLYLFLVSIEMMGAAFKGFGKDFAHTLITTTSNPFIGLFIGILATSLVQSSSTVTSLVVGIVAAKGLTVSGAIPIIMGANIGTTVTNTLVSLGHVGRRDEFKRAIGAATVHDFFNLICVSILFPLELTTGYLEKTATWMAHRFVGTGGQEFHSPIKMITKPTVKAIESLLHKIMATESLVYGILAGLALLLLFFALYFIVKVMKSLVVNRAEIVLDNVMNRSAWLGFICGILFTLIVQSSSITTSLTIPLVASGILTVEAVFPITIGANIGTTVTALLASLATGDVSALIIAFAHFLFNLTGTVVIYPIKIFRKVPIFLAKSFGNLAAEKRYYAFLYVLGLFFALPGLLILISRCF